MGKFIDLSGKTFGHLFVIERVEDNVLPSGLHEPMWRCRCDCARETIVRGAFLRSGHTQSCGCHQTGDNFVDLTDRWFHDVHVISRVPGSLPIEWNCECKCGKQFVTRGSSLLNGHTKSCGCRKKQLRIPDMIGRRSGRLEVIQRGSDEITSNGTRHIRWLCRCDCGRLSLVRGTAIRSQKVQSCGCLRVEHLADAPVSIGEIWISEYLAENGCLYESQKTYPDLIGTGGRLLSYDFHVRVNGLSLLIECQGSQHYEVNDWFGGEEQFIRQQIHDERKREYVRQHEKLRLLEVPYVTRMAKSELIEHIHQYLDQYSIENENK